LKNQEGKLPMQGQKKYFSDFAISLSSARWIMISSSELSSGGTMATDAQEVSDICHIYLICQHPDSSFSKEHFDYSNGHIEGQVNYKLNGEAAKLDFRIPYPLLDGAADVILSPYPHREIHSVDATGKTVRRLPASIFFFASTGPLYDPNLRQFKVLYVGQAFAEGKRSAFQRLKSHPTLQKILANASYNEPDSEIFLMMFEYPPYKIINLMDPRSKATVDDESDTARFYSILENPLSQYQQICLTEAALIRYFSPRYNEIFKESFPSPNHKLLQQCYNLDFTGLVVEIDTEELLFQLYSDSVRPSTHHTASINLVGHTDRLGFFHLSDGDNPFQIIPDLIS
jgi:hypothetical protein